MKTLECYMIVFVARYLDLFVHNPFRSVLRFYNTIMKILFLLSTAYSIYLVRVRYKHTYSSSQDTVRLEFFVLPAVVLAIVFHHKLQPLEIFWVFSILLEAVSLVPQLFMLQKTGEVENITSHYVFALGSYRALYVLNWVWRYFNEKHFWAPLLWCAGTIQTALFADFAYHYIKCARKGQKLKLPA